MISLAEQFFFCFIQFQSWKQRSMKSKLNDVLNRFDDCLRDRCVCGEFLRGSLQFVNMCSQDVNIHS